jgi:hypothetical protein
MISLRIKSPAPPGDAERSGKPNLRIADPQAAGTDTDRLERLAQTICHRIETRLPGRVRNLAVRAGVDVVVLEGECATYYTKQLAQHAALGVLEDEHLENAIVVTIGR